MSYDNPTTVAHSYSAVDFGTASEVYASLKGPLGKKGRITSVIVTATEVFTTGGDVLLGIAADGAEYVNMPLATLAATDTLVSTAAQIVLADLPADTQIEITWSATGGTPTGIADVQIVVDWY